MFKRIKVFLTAASFFGGCSYALNWDLAGLPCSQASNSACLNGYSCAISGSGNSVCIEDHSLALGSSGCLLDKQCQQGLLCTPDTHTCDRACNLSQAYQATADCPVQQYCKPFYSTDGIQVSSLVATCVHADICNTGNSCSTNVTTAGVCIEINNNANACIAECEITWSATGVYSDNCGVDNHGYSRFCQPMGPSNAQYLTCLSSGPQLVPLGTSCTLEPINTPCPPGSACIAGACLSYCELVSPPSPPQSNCSVNQLCCPLNLHEGQTIGYCNSSCN